ncbi:bifunctional adenosylcobinamide kinase/adenosylcobinamide-phosphate guanylyltransferase [Limoniibacter endophyticus]|uniref:Bifunctional adenosylcobalamin biosynthesis protein n=1 Tax=Limoniibacter endophyticus TaxID=1565040 RepID=A0A8J3DQY3_9HYPH|nr:bifunctional adenosylcobinamide kinase/adenosylcobinamide-phosphate guanylyltransferase [Limoniibacter endophyticus]GHC78428.1 adenosylcobinamide kinase/adenosylcobinamide phosphate guanyltransferase [Limoniibacter endophyticus]
MTGTLDFIIGGARSGKSAFAEKQVRHSPAPWVYIATAQAFDEEMQERIAHHRAGRAENDWRTVDAPFDLVTALETVTEGCPLLVDCLTLWLTNHMLAESDLEFEIMRLADCLANPRGPWVVVSNEVGYGIVPENPLARRFRDEAGRLNQRIAAVADRVFLVAAGLPLQLK